MREWTEKTWIDPAMTQPLFSGLKVLDCAGFVAAPAAARGRADFGADVIKLEPTGEGDPWRTQYKRHGMPPSEINHPWLMDSRNKRPRVGPEVAGWSSCARAASFSDRCIHHQRAAARPGAVGHPLRRFRGAL